MSSRFHNKYHRHNHHSRTEGDPRYPDASHDPIASQDFPFIGPFHLWGTLSGTALDPFGESDPVPAAVFYSDAIGLIVSTSPTGVAIQADGDVNISKNLNVGQVLSAEEIHITGNVINVFENQPLSATGEFLEITLGLSESPERKYIRLWQL